MAMVSLFGTSACAQKKGENMCVLDNEKPLVANFCWSGTDRLIDVGNTASYWHGDLQYLKATH